MQHDYRHAVKRARHGECHAMTVPGSQRIGVE
jgi:hypothetical protein